MLPIPPAQVVLMLLGGTISALGTGLCGGSLIDIASDFVGGAVGAVIRNPWGGAAAGAAAAAVSRLALNAVFGSNGGGAAAMNSLTGGLTSGFPGAGAQTVMQRMRRNIGSSSVWGYSTNDGVTEHLPTGGWARMYMPRFSRAMAVFGGAVFGNFVGTGIKKLFGQC